MTSDPSSPARSGNLGLYRLGAHFYQVGHGSHPMVISGIRMVCCSGTSL